ncbi:putative alpha-galactosidase B [Lophiotrema nucula]|uniref:Alpha-galactosidase n=1 Tax=Lophiotrema nucula TaxID=690887 RepID=A0A6A5ZKV7_9PLEO|nr:putative alpha-galactosidase B [Lophiotrema nucula]
MWKVQYLTFPLLCTALVPKRAPSASDAPIGKLPALGWNSWNAYGCDINEQKILDAADRMNDLGLKDAGYEYVNIDDCWGLKNRDSGSKKLVSDPAKFPHGIRDLAIDIHNKKNLKIGIYSSAGYTTCQGYPASLGNEILDAKEWAYWEIDYLKYDNCGVPDDHKDSCRACVPEPPYPIGTNGTCLSDTEHSVLCPPDYNYETSKSALRYEAMGEALADSGRPILYSICNWGEANVKNWGAKYAHSWRSTNDINTTWPRILEILNQHSFQLHTVDFHAHADADMLEIGNGLSSQQSRTHFALWAAMKSPLLIGTDLNNIKPWELDILKNKYLLAFNQDNSTGKPAMPYKWGTNPNWTFNASFPAEFWSGSFTIPPPSSSPSSKPSNATLILLFNPFPDEQGKFVIFDEIPELVRPVGGWMVRNIWDNAEVGCFESGFAWKVEGYDTAGFTVGEACNPATS